MEQKTLHFACYIRGQKSAVSVHCPVGILDEYEEREDYEEFRRVNKERVSRPQTGPVFTPDTEEDLDAMPGSMDE